VSGHPHQGKNEAKLNHSRLLELVLYDPKTGYFTAKVGRQGARRNRPLGHVESTGYRRVCIDGMRFLAHRLAWFYMKGDWPVSEIDHKDLDKDNNKWSNLREATTSLNHANTRQPRGYNAPLKGAHWNKHRKYWVSRIFVHRKGYYLGAFKTAEEAHAAYVKAAKHFHGSFHRAA
jgi:hypothetical protein